MKTRIIGASALCVAFAASGALAQDFCQTAAHSGSKVEVSTNKVDKFSNGIGYELWNEGGNGGSATFYDDGSFSCKMTGAKDYLCRAGLSFNSDKTHEEIGHMKADFKLVKGNLSGIDYSYIGIYGWTREPLVEWYIVDNSGSQYMPGDWVAQGSSKKAHGEYEIDGAKYKVYEGDRTSYSIDGDNTYFKQYFSVRTSMRDCGTIDITAHFKKWEELGMRMGKLHEAKILGEAGSNSGPNARGEYDFPYAKVYIEGAAPSSSETPSSSSEAPKSSSDAKSSSSVGPASSSDAQSSSSVGPASSSDAVSSSSAPANVSSSSSGLALPAEMKVFRMSGTAQVFDMQGKFLGTVELKSGASLKEIVVNKFGKSGMYLLKQGAAVKVVSAEKR
ncbi:glycoside hydrolase family 11 protein [uncultured Fibrobacter sp.]|uniref:glycoside hydrolase family 11 protein n=1 Tax=uncultured Fibrobacter sp. TaxID=261512 RepID=UPI0025DB765D|nr:glycoside hydrolase family 11 protein [uncultured Fibrobacter sp.]